MPRARFPRVIHFDPTASHMSAGLRVDPDIVFDLLGGGGLQIKINFRIGRRCLHIEARFYRAVEDDTDLYIRPVTIGSKNNDRERRSWS